jgi:hypothetical chaperone protein
MIGVGVDFGTSNSTVAWFDGVRLRFVAMESRSPILPSAVHLSREYVGSTGTQAIDLYVQENAARLVQLAPQIVGTASRAIEDRSTDTDRLELETSRDVVYGPLVDHGLPGRLFLALKRLLANPGMSRLSVFGRPFRLVALLTPMLLRMRESVERELRGPVGHVHIGRPVNFEGGDAGGNALALKRLAEACAHAGLRDVEFYPEPLAATLSFVWQQQRQSTGTVLTVDFGGGTLDLSVVRYAGVEFTVLATAGAALGGDRIDQLMFRRFLFPLLGEGETWVRRVDGRMIETAFPFSDYEEGLLNWAITHTLNQNRYKTRLTELIARGGRASAKFERLKDLINYNYSYQVFGAIKKAKAELSETEATTIDIPELNLTVPVTRRQFDETLVDVMARLADLIDQVLAHARLEPEGIDVVVRTGGSSQIVAVRQLLERRFPGRVTEHDPFTSVAGGLAIANYRGHHFGNGL